MKLENLSLIARLLYYSETSIGGFDRDTIEFPCSTSACWRINESNLSSLRALKIMNFAGRSEDRWKSRITLGVSFSYFANKVMVESRKYLKAILEMYVWKAASKVRYFSILSREREREKKNLAIYLTSDEDKRQRWTAKTYFLIEL